MFKIIFTSDYEIHGNGDGSPSDLMVEPTYRMMELFDKYGAKLTIMADVAEILKFKEHFETTGNDTYNYKPIEKQLIHALNTGHDVQLHVHPSYFNAVHKDGNWYPDYSEYDVAGLNYNRISEIIQTCKQYLEDLLKPVKQDYQCIAFRAANWSMQPSKNIIRALIANRILIDTSVFKYGKRDGLIHFDYTGAFSDLIPWPVSMNDICEFDSNGKLYEIPIYCENRPIWSFLSTNRFFRVITEKKSKMNVNIKKNRSNKNENFKNPGKLLKRAGILFKKNAWKMDFNQCSGKQLIKGLLNAEKKYKDIPVNIPLVVIGHSKIFTKGNMISLEPFLKFIQEKNDRFEYGTFPDINISDIKNHLFNNSHLKTVN